MATRTAQDERERSNRLLLRTRDLMDRSFAEPLDVDALARVAHCSPAHFIRSFRTAFGETPYRYLQRRRIERATALLRTTGLPVQDICVAVGWTNLATFTRTFRRVVGLPPSAYRAAAPVPPTGVPTCFAKAWSRPSSFGTTPCSRPA